MIINTMYINRSKTTKRMIWLKMARFWRSTWYWLVQQSVLRRADWLIYSQRLYGDTTPSEYGTQCHHPVSGIERVMIQDEASSTWCLIGLVSFWFPLSVEVTERGGGWMRISFQSTSVNNSQILHIHQHVCSRIVLLLLVYIVTIFIYHATPANHKGAFCDRGRHLPPGWFHVETLPTQHVISHESRWVFFVILSLIID